MKSVASVGKYVNRHETLEKELQANRTRLQRLKEAGRPGGLVAAAEMGN